MEEKKKGEKILRGKEARRQNLNKTFQEKKPFLAPERKEKNNEVWNDGDPVRRGSDDRGVHDGSCPRAAGCLYQVHGDPDQERRRHEQETGRHGQGTDRDEGLPRETLEGRGQHQGR